MALLICSNIAVIDSCIAVIALEHNPDVDIAPAAPAKPVRIFHHPPHQSKQKPSEPAGFDGLCSLFLKQSKARSH
jgi:hypothetical protein